jgi:hypothetical protein
MNASGTWAITVHTPSGELSNTLVARSDGTELTGTLTGPGGEEQPIHHGIVDGDTVSWNASMTQPSPLEVAFTATVDGDRMTGTLKAGAFPDVAFEGHRIE